jgi:growth arrest-specific protein 8
MSKSTAKSASKATLKKDSLKKSKLSLKPGSGGISPEEQLKTLQDELALERKERNYFQLERDRISNFWEITKNELNSQKSELLNKDRELEELEEKHQIEIKVYKQKVKHLLYEYQNNVAHLQADSEKASQIDREKNVLKEAELKKEQRILKSELKEFELSHEDTIINLKQRGDQEITLMRLEFERKSQELHVKYGKKMKILREDLDLRRKNEIHEIEERKNSQINVLMKNHEKAFAEVKLYYNDITVNNLALINSLQVWLQTDFRNKLMK